MTEAGRAILRQVVLKINEVAPKGVGHWDQAWEIVSEPSDRFLDALSAWEASNTPQTREELQAAANDFVRSWRSAAERWRKSGRGTPVTAT